MKHFLLLSVFVFSAALLQAQAKPLSYQFNGEQSVFTENKGQVVDMNGKPVPDVLAKASMPGLDMYLTKTGVTYVLLQYTEDLTAKPHPVFINDKKFKVTYSRVDVALTGAAITSTQMQFTGEAGYKSNYYKTADAKGQLAVSHFKNLTVQNVYPGIDWVWKFNAKGNLEYEFIVHPGADPSVIKMQYNYADVSSLKNKLKISTRIGSITEGPLLASSGSSHVNVNYNLDAKDKTISFVTGAYDKGKDLVIDPPLALDWSAQFGGSFLNGLRGVTTDTSGGVYLVGYTTSNDFPVFNPGGGAYIDSTYNGQSDAIVLKLDTLQNLKWATFMGGPGNDFANSVCIDINANQNIYVTGGAAGGYPVVGGAANHGGQDAFVSIIETTNLSLKYSSFSGGTGTDEGLRIKFQQNFSGYYYVVGYTNSSTGSFITRQANGGYLQSTVTGQEAFIMQCTYDPYYNTSNLNWCTMYGGNGDDYATGVTLDSLNNIIVAGFTNSTDIPVSNLVSGGYYQNTNAGGNDGFVLKFNSTTALTNATYYGGSGNDYFNDVATGINGNFEFTGRTNSSNFPVDSVAGFGYNQTHQADTSDDAFIVKLGNNLKQQWSTYYGGNATDGGTGISTDNAGNMYLTGFTFSTNFPVHAFPGAYNQSTNHGNSDAFIALFSDLGIRQWCTYRGDSCYQYPNNITYDNMSGNFYVAGEGLLNCIGDTLGQSLPDTGQVNANGTSSVGFCWAFNGNNACSTLQMGLDIIEQSCPNRCNGVAQVTVSDTVPYSLIWSDGGTVVMDSNLCSGSWIEVDDSLGCTRSMNVVMSPLTINEYAVSSTCATNTLEAFALNGNVDTGYRYQWSTSPGYGDSNMIVVTPGRYNVTVMDAYGCTAAASDLVSSYPTSHYVLPISIEAYPACIDSSGWATIYYEGGPTGVEWTWPDGHNTEGNYIGQRYPDNVGYIYQTPPGSFYTVTDSNDCVNGSRYILNYTFPLPGILPYVQPVVANPSTCNSADGSISFAINYLPLVIITDSAGDSIGSELATVSIGYHIQSFAWSDGGTNSGIGIPPWPGATYTITNLSAGNYTITVTAGSCDSIILHTSLTTPHPQILPVTSTLTCGSSSIDASQVYDDTGPFTYLWSNGATSAIITGLTSGAYSVTVTDPAGCLTSDTVYVAPDGAISITLTDTGITCTPGSVTATPSGGTAPYSYEWNTSPGFGDSAMIFVSIPADYGVTVLDGNGCSAVGDSYIDYYNTPLVIDSITIYQYPSCGLNNGVLFINAPDPSKVYWTLPNSVIVYGDTLRNAPTNSGNIATIITDSSNCVNGEPISVTYSLYLYSMTEYPSVSVTEPLGCNTKDGWVNINSRPNMFNWLGISVDGQGLSNWYDYPPSVVNYAPLTYEWSDGSIFTINSIDSIYNSNSVNTGYFISQLLYLNAGTYSVTLTDGTCQYKDTVTLTSVNPPIIVDYGVTSPSCSGDISGAIKALGYANDDIIPASIYNPITGQDSVYYLADTTNNYIWSNGDTTSSAYNLTGGTYTVTITGPNACPVIDTFNLAITGGINVSLSDTGITCAPGSITATPTGGTAPYSYEWNTSPGYGDSATIFVRDSGSYTVEVKDSAGCMDTAFADVGYNNLPLELPQIEILKYPTCGNSNGIFILDNYSSRVSWTWPDGHVTSGYAIDNTYDTYSGGEYYIATDSENCVNGQVYPIQYYLDVFSPIDYGSLTYGPLSCFDWVGVNFENIGAQETIKNPNGNILQQTYLTSDSMPVITYTWSNDVEILNGNPYIVKGGPLSVTVTDGGCTSVLSTTLIIPAPEVSPVVDTSVCSAASINVRNVIGGVSPYIYQWSNGSTADTLSNLTTGIYAVTITGGNYCAVSDTFNIVHSPPVALSVTDTGITCSPGYVTATPTGGTGPYSYEWNTSPGFGDSATIFVRDTGVYAVTVEDGNGCSGTGMVDVGYFNLPIQYYNITVEQYPSCGMNNGVISFSNPDYSKVSWLSDNGDVTYGDTITDAYTSTWWNEFIITDSSNCLNGMVTPVQYSIYLYSAFGNDQPAILTVSDYPNGCNTQDGAINTQINTNWGFNTSINGQQTTDNGSFVVLNYQPVNYNWSNGDSYQLYDDNWQGDSGPFGLNPGIYTVTVTDGACSLTSTLNLTASYPPLIANYSVTSPPCNGGTNGKIDLLSLLNNVSSQNQWMVDTNTYVWSNGNTTQSVSNLTAGAYEVTITGPNACPVIDTFIVTQPTPLVVADTVTGNALCYGGTGIVHITATGGTAPYYGAGTVAEPAGNNLLVIYDQNGCADTVSATITQPTPVNVAIQWLDTIAPCRDTVKVGISVTGGNGPYTGTGTIVYTHSGNYTITVSDANGCTVDSTLTIHLDSCVDVKSIADDFGVSIYPNPATDKLYVKFMSKLTEPADMRLYAVDGKLVMLKTLGTGTDLCEIDCTQLASGVYVLRTVVMNKEYNFKVVVTR